MKSLLLTNNLYTFFQVDDDDEERVAKFKWRGDFNECGKCTRIVAGHDSRDDKCELSNFIMGTPPEGYVWDHKDLDVLNNTKANLRLATKQQNTFNRAANKNNKLGIKGLRQLPSGSWNWRITLNGKIVESGTCKTREEAIVAWNKAALVHHGEFAHQIQH